MHISRKRLLVSAGGITAAGAVAALVVGSTLGLFSSTPASETNSFAAGTVTLSSDATGACTTTTNIAPGDGGTCTFKATYSGSLPAYIGLNVLIETQAGSGGTKLYNPADSTKDLSVTISDGLTTYTIPATATTCSGAPAGSTCYELDNELVSDTPASGGTTTWTTTWSLPTASGNGYQGGAAQVILTAHAVQSAHNPNSGTTDTPGAPTGGDITWS